MNRLKATNSVRFAVPLLSLLALGACSSGSSSPPPIPDPNPPAGALLKKVAAPVELEDSLKAGFTTVFTSSAEALASSGGAGGSAGDGATAGNFTGTYTQEMNVDEFDAVRYDGEYLYVAPRRSFQCCFILAESDGASNTGNAAGSSIRILATDPANAEASAAGTIPLEEGISVQGMYVESDRLFALTAEAFYGSYGDFWSSVAIWAPERLGFHVYDLTDRSAPALDVDVSMDGVFVESRRIGNVVYIVSRYAPQIEGIVYDPRTADEVTSNETLLAGVSLDEMLPTITIDGVTQPLVDPANCYLANDDRVLGYPVITSVTAVPIDDPDAFVNTCFNADLYGVYVSETAIYLPEVLGYLYPGDTQSRIHKFALSGTALDYRGSADIDGVAWRGGQSDFRMSEHDGDLRVVATDWLPNDADFVDHLLYVLRESPTETALVVVSRLPNDSRPTPIGKPNEQLYGVRFLGDRAYAVTFEQIDPLYVIDLSNPADPRIAGELEVTGFSDFLHPVTDDLLLGLGTGAAGGVKLELFDVSDISLPLSRGAVTIGNQFAFSEARWDRHAFAYQPDVGGIDRLAVPATVFDEGGSGYETSLYLFEIRDKVTPSLASLIEAGKITPSTAVDSPFTERNRAFLHDDTVYYVRDEDVWAAFWLTPTMVNGPF